MGSFFSSVASLAGVFGMGFALRRLMAPSMRASHAGLLGLLAAYGILFLPLALSASLMGGAFLAFAGWWACFQERPKWRAAALVPLLFFLPTLLFQPLSAWDARSVWFFHAKMLFYNGSVWEKTGWVNPSYAFSHLDYPLLAPGLAAQIATLAGFWNEYLPKVSLLLLFMAALFPLLTFCRSRLSTLFLFAFLVLRLGPLLWNGYMDGYLALYTALAALLFGSWFTAKNDGVLVAAFAALAITLGLKNEGIVVAGAAAIAGGFSLWRSGTRITLPRPRLACFLAACFAIFACVYLRKLLWGIGSEYGWSSGTLARVGSRLVDINSGGQIIEFVFFHGGIYKAFLLLLALAVAARKLGRELPASAAFSLVFGCAYVAGLVLFYLSTPYELLWQLLNSADRTTQPALSLFFVTIFFCLREWAIF